MKTLTTALLASLLLKTALTADLRSISSIEYKADSDGPRYLDMENTFISDDETVKVLVTGPEWDFSAIEGDDKSTHFVDISDLESDTDNDETLDLDGPVDILASDGTTMDQQDFNDINEMADIIPNNPFKIPDTKWGWDNDYIGKSLDFESLKPLKSEDFLDLDEVSIESDSDAESEISSITVDSSSTTSSASNRSWYQKLNNLLKKKENSPNYGLDEDMDVSIGDDD